MSTNPGALPPELHHLRQWLRDVFQEASRGLPWPQQAGLLLIEQALVAGMFGGLVVQARMLDEARRASGDLADSERFTATIAALEAIALGPLPAQVQQAVSQLMHLPGGTELLERTSRDLLSIWRPLGWGRRDGGEGPRSSS